MTPPNAGPVSGPGIAAYGPWLLSHSHDRRALDIVDGTGPHDGHGPHYSRRTPGSRSFVGVGQEIVLVHESGLAVWAVVRQRTPHQRRRDGEAHSRSTGRYLWRNMLFRRLPGCPDLASNLIRSATWATYDAWADRYGTLPEERLRTEVDTRRIRSPNPGCCYKIAGWVPDRVVRGKLYLFAPEVP